MSVFLHGLRLKNYRGIGNDFVELAPLKKMNFLIGKNNSGKSIFLDFLNIYSWEEHLFGGQVRNSCLPNEFFTRIERENTELHLLSKENKIEVQFAFEIAELLGFLEDKIKIGQYSEPNIMTQLRQSNFNGETLSGLTSEAKNRIIATFADKITQNGLFWAEGVRNKDRDFLGLPSTTISHLISALSRESEFDLGCFASTTKPMEHMNSWVKNLTQLALANIQSERYSVIKVPSNRSIAKNVGEEIGDKLPIFSMINLVKMIDALSRANFDEANYKEKYKLLNSSLSKVIGVEKVSLRTSRDRETVLLKLNEMELPLEKLGKGFEDIVVILFVSIAYDRSIICVEEPELNLHPLLQRRLIRYLQENTNNQYLISTHSPSVIDAAEGSIFEITHDGIQTRARLVEVGTHKREICDDLGYKASDLLQSNCVIWVEGPSDKILINHWISLHDTDLVEGIHYSIMFYGGRLLSHLTAEWDKALSDFIELRRINANTAIIMDSDKKSETEAVNETKKRIEDELSKEKNSYCWITAGREIENYLDFERFIEIAKDIHPRKVVFHDSSGDFDDWYKDKDLDKVKIARRYAETNTSLERLDLKEKIEGLVQFIKKSNLME